MKTWWLGGLAGAALVLTGGYGLSTWRYLAHTPPPSLAAAPRPLAPVLHAPATIVSGTPNFRSAPYAASPDGRTSSGIWASDGPATFDWHFANDETVYVLEGRVDVTYQGHHFSLKPGDTAVFHGGHTARWHVPEHLTKTYTLHHPNALVRWWRRQRH